MASDSTKISVLYEFTREWEEVTHLTNPEMKVGSGIMSRPKLSFAKVRSIVAMMFAAASHMLASANI